MTYIDYLNEFNKRLRYQHIPGNARLLYYSLLAVFNEAGWPASIQVDNYRLMSMIDVKTERVAISARDKLVDFGFIRYSRGKKGSPNSYSLTEYTEQKVSVSGSENVSVSGSENVSVSCSETVSHIKTKTKNKTKKKEISPDGEIKKNALATVMSAYLNRINPQMSERGRDELAGFVEVMGAEVCLRAIDAALDAKAANWNYIRKILQTKQSQGVRCLADWNAVEEKRKKPKKPKDADPDDWKEWSV